MDILVSIKTPDQTTPTKTVIANSEMFEELLANTTLSDQASADIIYAFETQEFPQYTNIEGHRVTVEYVEPA